MYDLLELKIMAKTWAEGHRPQPWYKPTVFQCSSCQPIVKDQTSLPSEKQVNLENTITSVVFNDST